MQLKSLLSSFVSQNRLITAIKLITGALLDSAVKRSTEHILPSGRTLLLIFFVGICTLPESISLKLKRILGDIFGKALETVIPVSLYRLGEEEGVTIGFVVS